MEIIQLIGLIYGIAIVSVLAPGMLNMTAVSVSLEKGKQKGVLFALGAAISVFGQSFIASYFSKYLAQKPSVITFLSKSAIVIFILLAIAYFLKARKESKIETKKKKGSSFRFGIVLSSLNTLAIPFYLTVATSLISKEMMQPIILHYLIFSCCSALGAFTVFYTYSYFSEVIQKRARFITSNINYILSGLFFVLALIAVVKSL